MTSAFPLLQSSAQPASARNLRNCVPFILKTRREFAPPTLEIFPLQPRRTSSSRQRTPSKPAPLLRRDCEALADLQLTCSADEFGAADPLSREAPRRAQQRWLHARPPLQQPVADRSR